MGTKVLIAESPKGMGKALFACATFEPGDFVAEYTGTKIPTAVADSDEMAENRYLFELNDEWTIDGTDESNIARYINHSCEPNCEAEITEDDRIVISATEPIQEGTEFTIDYGEEYFADFLHNVCLCGTPSCRISRKA